MVEALRSRDPIALGAVYDDYAVRLYAYCWFQLHDRDAAQVAFRDALLGAEAHAGRLRPPARFGPWLYAFARIECRRRRPAGPVSPDPPVARHDQDDVDLRLMAWRAVTGLPPLSRELLDLRHRHGLSTADIALVTGLRARDAAERLDQAGVLLEAALIAEILAHDDVHACAGRAAILRPRRHEIDDDLRETLVRHSIECARCARHLPDNVAPAKVYALLPWAEPPQALRAQIMNCFTDPDLAGYRLFAAERVSRFGAHGFPVQPDAARTPALRGVSRRTAHALTAVAGAVVLALVAALLCRHLGEEAAHGSHGVVAAPPGPRSPRPSPAPPGGPAGARPVAADLPLVDPGSPAPVPVIELDGPMPPQAPARPPAATLEVAPGRLTLPAGGTGTITLGCGDTAVQWHTSGTGPLGLSPAGGTLEPGDMRAVTVRAPSVGPGSTVIDFWPGGAQVMVVWSGGHSAPPPTPPAPPPAPTPTPRPPTTPPPTQPSPTPTHPPSEPAPTPPPHSDPPPTPPPTPSGPAT